MFWGGGVEAGEGEREHFALSFSVHDFGFVKRLLRFATAIAGDGNGENRRGIE